VFDFPWCDDFAAARNEALRRARGGWVLILDADERLAPGSGARLRAAVHEAVFDCGMLRLHDAARVDASAEDVLSGRARQAEIQLVPRLLRRADGLSYVDPIHENVMPWLVRRGTKVAGVDVDVVHLGATKEVVDARGKLARNIRLLRVRLARDPADLGAYGYLAHDYMRQGAMDDALATAELGWTHALAAPTITTSLHRLVTARAYLLIGRRRFAEARDTIRRARALEGDCPDYAFFDGYAAESEALDAADSPRRAELLVAARAGYRGCLAFGNRVFAQSFVTGARGAYGRTRLATVELLLGNYSVAVRIFEAATALSAGDRAARLGIAEATLRIGDAGAALKLLQPLLDHSPDAWIVGASAALTLGRADDARVFVECAEARTAVGFVAAHRRRTLADLRGALATRVA
jgi:tetratricopeptide (TPR) repeat protein